MPEKLYNSFKNEDPIQAKKIIQCTAYIPKTIEKKLNILYLIF
jgi:hypothetical protein